MVERERSSFSSWDLLGLVLFVPGAFLSVLVVMDLFQSGGVGWTGRLAASIATWAGHTTPLVAAVGLAATGVAVYLRGAGLAVGRHLAAVVLTAAGVEVLLGAVTEAGGGILGASSGGWIARNAGEFLGMMFGIVATVVPVWLLWLRPMSPRPGIRPLPAPASPAPQDSIVDGVSPAEAEALVPDERFVSYMEQVWKHARTSTLPRNAPPSPYPEDVRLKGLVPPGARPLSNRDAITSQPRAPAALTEHEDAPSAEGGAYVPLGKDLADKTTPSRPRAAEVARSAGIEPVAGTKAPLGYRAFFGTEPEPRPKSKAAVPPAADVARTSRDRAASADAKDGTGARSGPPQPSWEQSPLFEAERTGTKSGQQKTALASAGDDEPELELEEAGPASLDVADRAGADVDAVLSSAEEVDELAEDTESEAFDGDDEDEDLAGGDDDDEDDLEDSEDDEDDEDDEDSEDDDEDADEDDDEDSSEDGDDESAELEEDPGDEGLLAQTEVRPWQPATHLELASASRGEKEALGSHIREDERANATEQEVVLEPHPAPRPRHPSKPAVRGPVVPEVSRPIRAPEDHEDLVLQAGMLFLQHGRVAVSLLQRHFGLDFDAACELLDELQQRGLIGPYRGGQRRDILLSAEQWMERVASS